MTRVVTMDQHLLQHLSKAKLSQPGSGTQGWMDMSMHCGGPRVVLWEGPGSAAGMPSTFCSE